MILSYTNIAIKLALGLISLIIVINITGKEILHLPPLLMQCKIMFWVVLSVA